MVKPLPASLQINKCDFNHYLPKVVTGATPPLSLITERTVQQGPFCFLLPLLPLLSPLLLLSPPAILTNHVAGPWKIHSQPIRCVRALHHPLKAPPGLLGSQLQYLGHKFQVSFYVLDSGGKSHVKKTWIFTEKIGPTSRYLTVQNTLLPLIE